MIVNRAMLVCVAVNGRVSKLSILAKSRALTLAKPKPSTLVVGMRSGCCQMRYTVCVYVYTVCVYVYAVCAHTRGSVRTTTGHY